jgi:hypothetical protein
LDVRVVIEWFILGRLDPCVIVIRIVTRPQFVIIVKRAGLMFGVCSRDDMVVKRKQLRQVQNAFGASSFRIETAQIDRTSKVPRRLIGQVLTS